MQYALNINCVLCSSLDVLLLKKVIVYPRVVIGCPQNRERPLRIQLSQLQLFSNFTVSLSMA